VPEAAAASLARDFTSVIWRGSILRVEYENPAEPRADEGALLLAGEASSWLMRIGANAGGQPQLTIAPLNTAALAGEIVRLVSIQADVPS
jgi:hypothetical protein